MVTRSKNGRATPEPLDDLARAEALRRLSATDAVAIIMIVKALAGRLAYFHGTFRLLDKRGAWPVSRPTVESLRVLTRPLVRNTHGDVRGAVATLGAAIESNLPDAGRLREILSIDALVDQVALYNVIVTGTPSRPVFNYLRVARSGNAIQNLYEYGGHVEKFDADGNLVPMTLEEATNG